MPSDNIARLKFTVCKILRDEVFEEITIDEFNQFSSDFKSQCRDKIYCPDCEEAKLTYVNALTPYFRTSKNSSHSDYCGKSVRSTIRNTDDLDEVKIERLINRIINPETRERTEPSESRLNYSQRSISKYKSKSLNAITDEDEGLYYCFYARNIRLTLKTSYSTYNFIRIYRPDSENHFFSIKIKKEYFQSLPVKESGLYNIAVFGKFLIKSDRKDVIVKNPRFLKII